MNIDEHPQIAGQLGVQSIPAVFAFQRGQPVDGFMGALPESQIKGFIERLVGPARRRARRRRSWPRPTALAAEGDVGGAAELYAAVLAQDPENVPALAALVKLHVELGDLEGAKRFLAMAPQGKANDPAIAGARAAIELAEQAGSLGDLARAAAPGRGRSRGSPGALRSRARPQRPRAARRSCRPPP